MAEIPTTRIDPETLKKLKALAARRGVSMVEQLRIMVEDDYVTTFANDIAVVAKGELPRPIDSDHHVPVYYIPGRQE